MKICSVCLSSDLLCSGCSRRLNAGEINQTEIDISRALHKNGTDAEFAGAFEENRRIFVVVDSLHAKKFIGPGGKNIKSLSTALGRPVKLLERAAGSEKHVIEKLIGAPVLGINKIYPQENFKIRIEKRYIRNVQPLEHVISRILNKRVSFIFE